MGAAITINVATIVMAWLYLHYSQKFYPIPFEFKRLIMLFGVGFVLFALAMFCEKLGWWPGIILKLGLLAIFPFALYFIGFFEKIELLRMKQGWQKWKNPSNWKSNLTR
jgi:O-antigen/teichoic acid export membrane protein